MKLNRIFSLLLLLMMQSVIPFATADAYNPGVALGYNTNLQGNSGATMMLYNDPLNSQMGNPYYNYPNAPVYSDYYYNMYNSPYNQQPFYYNSYYNTYQNYPSYPYANYPYNNYPYTYYPNYYYPGNPLPFVYINTFGGGGHGEHHGGDHHHGHD